MAEALQPLAPFSSRTKRTVAIYRIDRKNVGDWWSPPHRYFPFRTSAEFDILKADAVPNDEGTAIVGGGGLGNEVFRRHLRTVAKPGRHYSLVAWGVGADTDANRGGTVVESSVHDGLLSLFEGFDEIGTRIWSPGAATDHRLKWVPCASAMHPLFADLRTQRPSERLGVYEHLRVPLVPRFRFGPWQFGSRKSVLDSPLPRKTNYGKSLRDKLEFLARFEFIVTNSYHGVYWATLLGRRVVCQPFKNGLYSFKHRPAYLGELGLDAALEQAQQYPDAYDECRQANIDFYRLLLDRYGDI